jgi:hypothetical protein
MITMGKYLFLTGIIRHLPILAEGASGLQKGIGQIQPLDWLGSFGYAIGSA